MANREHDLVVIGSGPGGYVAAIRAAQLGLNTAIIEQEPQLGGTCLRIGCIPSKAMLESSERYHEATTELAVHGVKVSGVKLDLPVMLSRKDEIVKGLTGGVSQLMKKNKIAVYTGHGRIDGSGKVVVDSKSAPATLQAKYILIATGSKSAALKGVECDGDRIGTSTEALSYPEVPKHLIVIGAGAIGLELGSVWQRLGAKVTVLEYLDRILPGMDVELASEAQKTLAKHGMDFRLCTAVTGAKVVDGRCVVMCEGINDLEADRVLVAVGRVPNTDDLGLESASIRKTDRGFVEIGAGFATSAPGVFAIGDVIGGAMLAHKAEDEGVACVEGIVNGYGHVNYDAIPAIVYTNPEIAAVGKSEESLKQADIAYNKGKFFFKGNGRARALNMTDGWVKVLADATTDRVLGVHIIGPRAGDLIAEAAVAIEFGASSEDIARSSHAHPTLSEAVREAAMAVDKRSIHS
ncbi:MAG: dihydrolipoyl dehydrogenase [Armatimonadota bacterium]